MGSTYPAPPGSNNPFSTNAPPTRRPDYTNTPVDAPPLYSPSDPLPPSRSIPTITTSAPPPVSFPTASTSSTTTDDRFAFLSTFDTIFLIDDSGSMAGRSWRETASAILSIAPVCTAHDSDGIDIHFLNHGVHQPGLYTQITSVETIQHIFNTVQPRGGTPTGIRLHQLLKPYLARYKAHPATTKPLNIVVITDGVPSDDVESVIVSAAKKLDAMDAPAWQVGIQFFQVGNEAGAAAALQELDDGLAEVAGGVRDMVDTVPFRKVGGNGAGLSGDEILKVVLGAVNRRLDRKKN
ncbi:MAG: hypothetical protein M1823_003378 [Watsoniomyces obsoletus]|nr:MAG: hypothetical protein M1823_003378 [Watsoniomyces obsoletus]